MEKEEAAGVNKQAAKAKIPGEVSPRWRAKPTFRNPGNCAKSVSTHMVKDQFGELIKNLITHALEGS